MNLWIGLIIGFVLVILVIKGQRRQDKEKIAKLQNKNKELSGENYILKSENARYKVFTDTIKDRVQLLEEKDLQKDTWFSDLIRHNPEQPFSKENIERLLEKHKLKDFDT